MCVLPRYAECFSCSVCVCVSAFTGMFSYTMLATSPIFCYPDWPRRFFGRFPLALRPVLPLTEPAPQPSTSCLYAELAAVETAPGAGEGAEPPAVSRPVKPTRRHTFGALFTLLYLTEQFFMPYSHFITQVLPLHCRSEDMGQNRVQYATFLDSNTVL